MKSSKPCRGRTSRPRTLMALGAFAFGTVALTLPQLAPAQRAVPLIPLESYQATSSDGMDAASTKPRLAGLVSLLNLPTRARGRIVYVDPSQIEYATVVPGTAIAAPSGPDIQVNDPSLDLIQYPPGANYPFENATESEATLVADGQNIVVSYNSTANTPVAKVGGNSYGGTIYFTHQFDSAYSVSHDGGATWRSDFIPPSAGSIATYGDGVVAKDRAGNFYYASLGQTDARDVEDDQGNYSIIVAKSTDHGDTFSTAQTVAVDIGSDKEWMAIGPDPVVSSRDNIYVTWISFRPNYYSNTNSVLAFSRSTDGGTTWSPVKTLFAYTNDGVLGSYVGSGSTPTVDKSNGRLYVSFMHLGHQHPFADHHYIRVLASDDGGNTFAPLAFNVPGAPNPFVYPIVRPDMLADCGVAGGIRPVVKQGPDIGGGIWTEQFGLPRFVHCARLYFQPATVAENGRVVIAVNAVTAAAPSQMQIVGLYSTNGGATWFPPFVVAPATTNDPQHFHPAVALAHGGNTLYVGYYVQQANEQVRTELATFQLTDTGLQLLGRTPLSSVSFDLEPNNIPSPFPPLKSEDTVNFDQHPNVAAGYNLGEYMGVAADDNGNPIAAWGDSRNSWVSPANGLYPGVHPQTDVFFVRP